MQDSAEVRNTQKHLRKTFRNHFLNQLKLVSSSVHMSVSFSYGQRTSLNLDTPTCFGPRPKTIEIGSIGPFYL